MSGGQKMQQDTQNGLKPQDARLMIARNIVANSLEHAFQGRDDGSILVRTHVRERDKQ
jgi:two-component sensor histidine kinase